MRAFRHLSSRFAPWVALPCLVAAMAASALAVPDTTIGKDVVAATCNRCHGFDFVCNNLGQNVDWWKKTTKRMISNGAPISVEQAKDAAMYLAGLEKGASDICN